MNKPELNISIIIVTYNSGKILKDCLNSLQRNIPDDEIIVVDNHPEDADFKDCSSLFPEIRFISNPENNGFGGGNNLGVRYSSGELLFFLNPDTVVEEFNRESIISHYNKNPLTITGFPLYYPDGKYCKPVKFLPEIDFILPKKLYNPLYKAIFTKDTNISPLLYISGAAFIIRKDLFELTGGFDESYFLFFEENELRSSLKKIRKYNPYILSKGFKIIHHEGKSYNRNAIKWYSDSLKIYSQKHRKIYLPIYKRFSTFLSLIVSKMCNKDGKSKRILINELKKH